MRVISVNINGSLIFFINKFVEHSEDAITHFCASVSIQTIFNVLIRNSSMEGWTATLRHGLTKKEVQKDYSIQ